ncbi:MAG TPA: transcription termination/antitermination NusG family protein [bacterium]|nr:transcription termination/antitermination NusG family protein [bacterium]
MRWPENRALEEDLGNWQVAYLKPRNEKAMAQDCEHLGIGYFLPLYRKTTRRRDNNKPRKSIVPLFPGYFPFVQPQAKRSLIHSTDRVIHILNVIDQAQFVSDLRQVWCAVTSGVPILGVVPLEAGDRVRVTQGPLEGLIGVVQEIRGQFRVFLSVEALRMAVHVELDRADLTPL